MLPKVGVIGLVLFFFRQVIVQVSYDLYETLTVMHIEVVL